LDNLVVALETVRAGNIFLSRKFASRRVFKALRGGGLESIVEKLSRREVEVFQLFGQGAPSSEVAEKLGLSIKTIETHRAHILEKLELRDAQEMVELAQEWTLAMSCS
jgi:DNA-binding NarL/FixJ family response regulator